MGSKSGETTRVNMTLPSEVNEYLVGLTECGLYGTTPSHVARTLVTDKLKDLVREGLVTITKVERRDE